MTLSVKLRFTSVDVSDKPFVTLQKFNLISGSNTNISRNSVFATAPRLILGSTPPLVRLALEAVSAGGKAISV
jgi:hypothetical protein